MKTSSFLSLNLNDYGKGLIVAIGAGVFALIQTSIEHNVFTFDFTSIWHTALGAAIAYLGKNLFTDAKIVTSAK